MVSQRQPPRGLIAAAVACATAVLVATGCGGAAQPVAGRQPSWVHVTERFAPNPPVARQNETVELHLTDAAGRPLDGATVDWSASMSMPGMLPAAAKVVPAGSGTYTGRTVFVMAGPWRVTVQVAAGGRRATITLDVGVNE